MEEQTMTMGELYKALYGESMEDTKQRLDKTINDMKGEPQDEPSNELF